MPTRQGGRPARKPGTSRRRSLRRTATVPSAAPPGTWKTLLARSRPIVTTRIGLGSWSVAGSCGDRIMPDAASGAGAIHMISPRRSGCTRCGPARPRPAARPRSSGRAGSGPPDDRGGRRSCAGRGAARGGRPSPSRASAVRRAGGSGAAPRVPARRERGASRTRGAGRRRSGRYARAARLPPRPGPGWWGSRAAKRRSRRRWRRSPGRAWPRGGWPARRRRTRTGSRDPPGEKSRGLPEDLDLFLEPLVLALEPLQLGLLGLAGGPRLPPARGQGVVPPRAELPGAHPQLGRDLRQPSTALEQALDRLRLEPGREPAPGPPLHHLALLGCSGPLANPSLPRGKSILSRARGPVMEGAQARAVALAGGGARRAAGPPGAGPPQPGRAVVARAGRGLARPAPFRPRLGRGGRHRRLILRR